MMNVILVMMNVNLVYFVSILQDRCSATTVSLPESLLFVSTLDGNLHAVNKRSGSIKWTLKEGKRDQILWDRLLLTGLLSVQVTVVQQCLRYGKVHGTQRPAVLRH